MQKLYTPKCGQGTTKIDLFRDFLAANVQDMNFIPVKVSTLSTTGRGSLIKNKYT
jgi:hypothetical protein